MASKNRPNTLDRLDKPLAGLEEDYPFLSAYLEDAGLDLASSGQMTLAEALAGQGLSSGEVQDKLGEVDDYLEDMLSFLGQEEEEVRSVTILAGQDKDGRPETFGSTTIHKGEIMAIVGPTGSGKSRLLADIEWTAKRDTPTQRTVLINGKERSEDHRFSSSRKLVAQLSQNMNFVMDVTVAEFIGLHAQSRRVEDTGDLLARIVKAANYLCGEPFDQDLPITSLSGGQSRALMIADTAILSASPIVLIDEIENAGIDRKRALDVLVGEDKIVLIATHDPSLALLSDQRMVIRNGGIAAIKKTEEREKTILASLQEMDEIYGRLRQQLRQGQALSLD